MQALKGDLGVLGVADVLRFLARTGKSGRLVFEGVEGEGSVWLDGGVVVAVTAGGDPVRGLAAPLDEAVCSLLRRASGSFAFDPDAPPVPEGTGVGERVEDLLGRALVLLDEWQVLHEAIPSLDLRVRMVEAIPAGEHRTVTAEQWRVLVAIGRECSVGSLAETLGLSELGVLRLVHDLVTAGLAGLASPRPPVGRAPRRSTQSVREGYPDAVRRR